MKQFLEYAAVSGVWLVMAALCFAGALAGEKADFSQAQSAGLAGVGVGNLLLAWRFVKDLKDLKELMR
jgi:hypothetical protein